MNPVIAWVSLVVIAASLRYTVLAIQSSVDAVTIAREALDREAMLHAQQRKDTATAERAQRTFQMYQLWLAPSMLETRTHTVSWFDARIAGSTSTPIFIGTYASREEGIVRDLFYDLKAMMSFVSDVKSLIDMNMLDETMACRLFAKSMDAVIEVASRVDFRKDSGDITKRAEQDNNWIPLVGMPLRVKFHLIGSGISETANADS